MTTGPVSPISRADTVKNSAGVHVHMRTLAVVDNLSDYDSNDAQNVRLPDLEAGDASEISTEFKRTSY